MVNRADKRGFESPLAEDHLNLGVFGEAFFGELHTKA
jgi:hypothetical protein